MADPVAQQSTPPLVAELRRKAIYAAQGDRDLMRKAAGEIERLREVMGNAHGLLDEHMGDTDPADPDHPLLRAAQLLAEALP